MGPSVTLRAQNWAIMGDLEAIEARIWSLLEPYRAELEAATIYGMPSLRWPGAKAHDYSAAVRAGKSFVSLYLLVADTYPDALAHFVCA